MKCRCGQHMNHVGIISHHGAAEDGRRIVTPRLNRSDDDAGRNGEVRRPDYLYRHTAARYLLFWQAADRPKSASKYYRELIRARHAELYNRRRRVSWFITNDSKQETHYH